VDSVIAFVPAVETGPASSCDDAAAVVEPPAEVDGFAVVGEAPEPTGAIAEEPSATNAATDTPQQVVPEPLRGMDAGTAELLSTLEELENSDALLVVGGNPRKNQPIIGHRIRKAAAAGANVMFINSVDYPLTFSVAHKAIVTPERLVQSLAGVAAALLQSKKARAPEALQGVIDQTLPDATEQAIAATLSEAGRATLLLGLEAGMHPAFSTLRALAVLVAELSGARVGFLSDGANSAGACLAGVLPHRGAAGQARDSAGLNAAQMIEQALKNYLLVGIEPEFDCADGAQALAAMQQAEFVVAMTPYSSERMRDYADVLLPMNGFSETSGTFVNCEGRWQSFAAASRAPAGSRPGWKVLRVLGNLLELDGFDQTSSEQVRDALGERIGAVSVDNTACGEAAGAVEITGDGLQRIASLPLYSVDNLVRRAEALQQTPDADVSCLQLHSADAARLGLADGDKASVAQGSATVELEVRISDSVAEGAAVVPMADEVTLALGAPFATLRVKKG